MTKNLAASRTEVIADTWTEICAYGTAVHVIPVTDGARQTASELGYRTAVPE